MIRRGGVWAAALVVAAIGARWAYAQPVPRAYELAVGPQGLPTSLRIGDAELLRAPMEFCPGVTWHVEGALPDLSGAGAHAELRNEKGGEAQVDYRFEPRRLVLTLNQKLKSYQSWSVPFSDAVLGVENLQDTGPDAAEAIQYVGRGDIRATPVRISRVQKARLYLRNGAAVLFWHDGWGAPFNLDEIGSFTDYTYRRNLVENDHPMRLYFQVERGPGATLQPAPVFLPVGDAFANVFYAGAPARFTLRFPKPQAARLEAAPRWRVTWKIRDYRDRPAGEGSAILETAAVASSRAFPITVPVARKGWFEITFALSPARPVTPAVAPSEFRTRLAVVTRKAGFPEIPAGTDNVTDYGYEALLGLQGIRESHSMRQFFPARGRANWKDLDAVFDRADRESKRWGVSWFFQANDRPTWCTPEEYEEIAFEVVSRYKDWCRDWEIENEPNFRYSPKDYVEKALVPFARGAKRADPDCRILGPACVSVPNSRRFLQAIVDADALKYLDAISTHTYVGPGDSWEMYDNPGRLRKLQALGGGKPLWQTEQGYNWGNDTKRQQTRYVARQFLNGLGVGIENRHHYYFYPVHRGFEPWYLVEGGTLAAPNGTLEPGGVALRVLNEQVSGLTPGKLAEPAFGVRSLRFSGSKEDLLALWTLDFPLVLRIRGAISSAVDLMGNAVPLKRSGSTVALPVDGEPVFLRLKHGAPAAVVDPGFGVNYAAASRGARITASSASADHPADQAIDGKWLPEDPSPPHTPDWLGTYWEAADQGASPEKPEWLEVTLAKPQTIDRVFLVTPLPAVSAVPRDFTVQASSDGKIWKDVASAKGAATWTSMVHFAPVRTQRVRLLITRLNDGWHRDGRWMPMVREEFTRYTSMKAMVVELMVLGR